MTRLRLFGFGVALVLASAGSIQAAFKPLVHLDLRGGMAGTGDQDPTWAAIGSFYAVPAVSLGDNLSFVPSLYANATGQGRSIEEDMLFVQSTVMGFRPSLKWGGSASTLTLRGDLRRNLAVAAFNEQLGQGYYDYEEYSGGLGWDGKALGQPVSLGLDISKRGYPYSRRQGSELLGGKNERTKDYLGYKGSLRSGLGAAGTLSYTLQWKDYEDSYVLGVDSATGNVTGVPGSQRQQDLLNHLSLDGGRMLNRAWSLGWGGHWTWNASNQNGFDAARNQGLPNAQDYQVLGLELGLGWRSSAWKANAGYSLNWRGLNRPVQAVDGSYGDLNAKISDVENGFSLGLGRKLMPSLGWVFDAGTRMVGSNQGFEGAGKPNYSFYSVTTGIEWDWQ